MKKLTDKIHKAFDNIKADNRLKESTKQFLLANRKNKTSLALAKRPALQNKFAIACLAIVLAAGIRGYLWIQSPVSYISIDVNPSIELALNRFDRVVSVTAYNPEGEEILQDLSLKGKIYTAAIDEIVENQAMDIYITEDSEFIFTIAANNSHENNISTGVQRCCGHSGHSSHSISADPGIVPQAHDNGLSFGKYYAYLQLVQYDDTITVDDCRDMSMSEIYRLITMYEYNTGYTDPYIDSTGRGGCHQTHGGHNHLH